MIATRPIDPFSNHRVDPFALTTLTRTFAMHSNCFSFFLSSDLSPVKQRPFSQCTTYALPAGDSPRFYSTASNKLKNRPCSLARPHGPNKISPHHHAFNKYCINLQSTALALTVTIDKMASYCPAASTSKSHSQGFLRSLRYVATDSSK